LNRFFLLDASGLSNQGATAGRRQPKHFQGLCLFGFTRLPAAAPDSPDNLLVYKNVAIEG
jgi:hypothetical protein